MTKPQVKKLNDKGQNSNDKINPNFKCKITKHKVLSFGIVCVLSLFWILCFGICHLYAQDNNKLVTLTKQIIEAKTNEDLYPAIKELSDLYLKKNKYNEFIDFLNSLANKKKTLEPAVNYYIALTRYSQLKHLEETQNWDEYFSKGNTYREQISQSLQKSVDELAPTDIFYTYARLILWKFHRDQQDTLNESALSDLMNATLEYAKNAKDPAPLKDVGDEFLHYGEKAKANQAYRLYIEKIVSSNIKDEQLNSIALGFLKEGNSDLAEGVYDVYIERIQKSYAKEKLTPILIDIAKLFSYSVAGEKDTGLKDPSFVEKVFKKIEEIGGTDALSEELLYLRAFNLEKAKDFLLSKDLYVDLLKRYPQDAHADEVNFKVGIIYTYVARDVKSGRAYFERLALQSRSGLNPEPVEGLAQKETPSPAVISSFYQLGLLSQWEQDYVKAKEYYNKLLEKAEDGFLETVTLTKERLKEIEQAKPIEYNLKSFLDVSLKEENAIFDMTKVDLKSSYYRTKKDQDLEINATPYTAQSGCMQQELQYLWSGELGKNSPKDNQPSFVTQYPTAGTKQINLVVISPAGVIDRNIVLVDID
jgi:tetratricopeptide (TPR) repeat protein